jgi:hypothetical protein
MVSAEFCIYGEVCRPLTNVLMYNFGHKQIHLIDLHTVEALVRLLDQWTVEQGQLVLEYALLTLLHLVTVEEARFRLYLTGVYRPFRSIILGDEGASAESREKAVLIAWFLFEWQVEKLEILDRKVGTHWNPSSA